jgi:ABC-type glycerol-3-phosphate transport system substrate-binding protein
MNARRKMLSRREFLVLSVGAAAGTALAACQPQVVKETVEVPVEVEKVVTATPAPAHVEIWKAAHLPAGEEGALVQGILDGFNADHPEIVAEYVEISWDGWMEKHTAAFASGEPPDVTYQPDVFAIQFAKRGQLLIVDEFPDVEEVKAQFYENTWYSQEWEGHVYGVPLIVGGSAFFWNKDHFEEAGLDPDAPPDTWDAQIEYAKALTTEDRPGMVICCGPCDQYPHETYPVLLQGGAELFNADRSEATFNSPEGVAAVQYMVDLIHEHQVAPRPDDIVEGLFNQGLTSFRTAQIGGTVSVLANEFPDLNFGIGPAPKGPAPEPEGRAAYGGTGMLSISSASRAADAAWQVVQFLTSPVPLKTWIGDGLHWFSVRPDTLFYEDDPMLKDAEPLVQYQILWPPTEWNVQEWDITGRYITAALNGQIGAEEALDQAVTEINALRE